MANAEKVTAVAELTERFRGSSGAVLTEYRGLTVAQLAEALRAKRAEAEGSAAPEAAAPEAAAAAPEAAEPQDSQADEA